MVVNLGEVVEPHARASSILAVARTANVAPQAMTKGSRTNVTAIKVHSAEVTATTDVATAATVAAAAAAACKGAGREAQPAQGDACQQYSCYVGHHDPLRLTARVYAPGRTFESMTVLGSDLRGIAVLDTSLRVNADRSLFPLTRVPVSASNAQALATQKTDGIGRCLDCRALPGNWRQLPAELGNSRALRRNCRQRRCILACIMARSSSAISAARRDWTSR
jgi:hypothetical protein